ncbi:MAG: hypothetical protein KCHDKBKB_00486 [Elusimicrobia bacterium]|nr:hypothetical protein [Elusimicrobiota bacterium]
MSILNKYVLRKFIRPFLASFAALCCLIFVSQIFDRLDRFLAEGVIFHHVLGFLISSMPYQAFQILPVACLLGTLFVVGNLSRSREYIAGLAGGLPPEKFLGGLFLAGIFISFLALLANETIIPPSNRYSKTVFREKIRKLGDWRPSVYKNLIVAGADGRVWTIQILNESTGQLNRVVIDQLQEGRLSPQIDAESAVWTSEGWKFNNGVIRTYKEDGLNIDHVRSFTEEVFNFSEKPSDFGIQEPQAEEMTYKNLRRHIHRMEALGVPARPLRVELMMKLSYPFACFVVVFIGIPLALHGKGNPALGIAAGLVLTLLYLGFMQFGKAMAQRLVPPWFGAWLGNICFSLIGLFLWWRMRRAA